MTPKEAASLTVAEMASFVEARKRKQLDDWKMVANVGYSTGLIASMSLSKTRPRFNEIYNFPKDEKEKDKKLEVERYKLQMRAWAENMNSQHRKVNEDVE